MSIHLANALDRRLDAAHGGTASLYYIDYALHRLRNKRRVRHAQNWRAIDYDVIKLTEALSHKLRQPIATQKLGRAWRDRPRRNDAHILEACLLHNVGPVILARQIVAEANFVRPIDHRVDRRRTQVGIDQEHALPSPANDLRERQRRRRLAFRGPRTHHRK